MNQGKQSAQVPRRALIVIGVSILLITLISILLGAGSGVRKTDPRNRRASSFFSDGNGMKAAYLLVAHFLPQTGRLTRPFQFHNDPDTVATLIVARPFLSLAEPEARAIEAWVARGGQLILALDEDWPVKKTRTRGAFSGEAEEIDRDEEGFLAPMGFVFDEASPVGGGSEAAVETETEDGSEVVAAEMRSPGSLLEAGMVAGRFAECPEPYLAVDGQTLVGMKRLGSGRVLVVPDGNIWSNERLGEGMAGALLVRACAEWKGAVLFDEFHQGFSRQRGLTALIFEFLFSRWGVAALQLLLAGLLLMAGPWRRFGALIEPKPPMRQNPDELIGALSGLFQASRARDLARKILHRHLLRRLEENHRFQTLLQMRGEGQGRPPESVARYRTLHREGERRPLSEAELLEAARLSGQILEEHDYERIPT